MEVIPPPSINSIRQGVDVEISDESGMVVVEPESSLSQDEQLIDEIDAAMRAAAKRAMQPELAEATAVVVGDLDQGVSDQGVSDQGVSDQGVSDESVLGESNADQVIKEEAEVEATVQPLDQTDQPRRLIREPSTLDRTNRSLSAETSPEAQELTTVVGLPSAYEVASNDQEVTEKEEIARVVDATDAWHLPVAKLTVEDEARRRRIRQTLEFYYNRMLSTSEDSPWSMMHHMIAWGADAYIWVGKPGEKRVSCIGWLCANGMCENARLLELSDGHLSAKTGPGLQGHGGQFLAMLAQARVRSEQPIRCDGKMFTVDDLIKREQLYLKPGEELTFKLIGLIHYLGTEAQWTAANGEVWDFPRMIQEEIKQPINGTTCGGTHRLMGLSYAVRRRIQEGYPIDGQWARAAKYTKDYREYAFQLRNPDGTFSSDFFRSRGGWGDLDRKVKTNGHVLEWIVFSSPHEDLANPEIVKSIDILTNWLSKNRYYDWGKGPMAHAIRALSLYDERVYGGEPGKRTMQLASRPVRIQPKPPKSKSERQMMIEATQPKSTSPDKRRGTKSPSGLRRLFRRGGGWH